MKLTRNHLTYGFLAVATIAAIAAVAGFPLVHYLPPDLLGALGTAGMLPFAMSGETKQTISEQITAFQAKRQAAADRMDEIMSKAAEEGRTLDEHENEQYDEASTELKAIDSHITRLKQHEATMVARATPVVDENAGAAGGAADRGAEIRGGVLSVRRNLPPGLRFTRFSIAMAEAKGNVMMAREIADVRYKDTPEVGTMLKAAIHMGGTGRLAEAAITKAAVTSINSTDTAVTQYADIQSEFVELLRPKMVLGRMQSLVRVSIYSRIARQLTGVSGSFVGEGAPKPVQRQTYDNITLGPTKAAVIVVMSDEAVRFSTIDAEMRARDDMVKGIATYLDKRFLDPSYSGVANVSPASITNGAVRYQSSGSTLAAIDADVRNAMTMFAANDVDPSTAVWIMPATVALRLSMKRTSQDELAFPDLSMTGGTWYGIPVIVSNAMVTSGSPAELQIALVTQSEVMMADDGGISIDMSTEASVQMNDAPSAGAQSLVSLWQNNLVGIRAEQYINWAAMRPNNLGIALIENTNY